MCAVLVTSSGWMNNIYIYIYHISYIPIARLLSPNISKQKPWKRRELRRRLSLALAAATSAAAARRAKGTPGKAVQVDVVEPWLEEIKWENYYPSLSMIIHDYPIIIHYPGIYGILEQINGWFWNLAKIFWRWRGKAQMKSGWGWNFGKGH